MALAVYQRIWLRKALERKWVLDDDVASGCSHAISRQPGQVSRQVLRGHPEARCERALFDGQLNDPLVALHRIGPQDPVRQPLHSSAQLFVLERAYKAAILLGQLVGNSARKGGIAIERVAHRLRRYQQ